MAVSIDPFSFTWVFTSAIGTLIFLRYAIKFICPWRELRTQIRGPPCYPFVGAAPSFIFAKNEDIVNILASFVKKYGQRFLLPMGPTVMVILLDADGVEKLLSSSTHISKAFYYELFANWLGDGLLLSTGSKWQHRRKLLTSAFHFKILEDYRKVFNIQTSIFITTLKKDCEAGKPFDIFPYITRAALDLVCETAMGVKLNAQTHRDAPYLKAVHSMCELLEYRSVRPWLYPNLLWKLTQSGRREAESVATIKGFSKSVIAKRKEERNVLRGQQTQLPTVEANEIFFTQRQRLAFLDILLDAQENGEQITDEDIREEVETFMFEGHDTTASNLGWTVMLLASYPDHQEKVRDEIEGIFGTDKERDITNEDLSKMKYLEMCLKESLRLYPPVPGLGRKLCSDLDLGDMVIPMGTHVGVAPYFVHRNPDVFPDPEKFDPSRFTPENCANRHPYAYIPFSAGPRNCIGEGVFCVSCLAIAKSVDEKPIRQKFALMEIKIMLAKLLRNFRVEAACDLRDIVVMAEFILRPRDGFSVRLIPV